MPNPQNMVNVTESRLFDEKEKQKMIQVMNKIMALLSANQLIGLTKNKKAEAKFVDDSVEFWNNILNPHLLIVNKKINDYWTEKSK